MNRIIDAAVTRTRTVLTILALILIWGVVAYINLPREADPDVDFPLIVVQIVHEGITPEDAERLLIKPMEVQLRTIEGLREMRATGAQGRAYIELEFQADFDVDQALVDVREKVDLARPELPEETEEPIIQEFNASLYPTIVAALTGDVSERTLYQVARNLKDEIETIPQVLEARIAGSREEQLEVVIDPVALESYAISADELYQAVLRNNRLVAAGALDTGQGRFAVKVPGLFEDARDLLSLPVKAYGDAIVTLSDVAEIRRTFKDRTSYARLDGQPTIAVEVTKRLGENIIATNAAVRRVVAEERDSWPAGITVTFTRDTSRFINDMVSDLQSNVTNAIFLVMIVIVAALGARSAALVGISIPSSFLFGTLVLSLLGYTINIMTLFGMMLSVGILVDGAIVVTELADRKMAEGHGPKEAYALAAKRMAWPVIASTGTTLAAFLPLLFWPDVVGEFMSYLPVTLIVVLGGSLLMALIFLPALGGVFGRRPSDSNAETMRALALAEDGEQTDVRTMPGLTGWYVRLLDRAVRHPGRVVLSAVALLIAVQIYYANNGNGIEFFVDIEPEGGIVFAHARGNLSNAEQDALVREVENQILALDGIKSAYTVSGSDAAEGSGGFGDNSRSADVIGSVLIEFEDWRQRRPADEIFEELRARTANLPGIFISAELFKPGPTGGKDVQIQLTSRYPEALSPAAGMIRHHMETEVAGLVDIEDSRPLPGIEWQLDVDRSQAGRFGADVTSVGNVVQLVTNGIKVGGYRPDDAEDELDIRVRFPREERTIDQFDQLRIQTPAGPVPVSNFVKREARPKVPAIRRVGGLRKVMILADVTPGILPSEKVAEMKEWLSRNPVDPRVTVKFRGADEEAETAANFIVTAFVVALFLMAIILVTQFNSFYHAFLILSAVIMSTVGVTLGLIVTGHTFSVIMTGVAIMALAGIVVNNNIVLIDNYTRLRAEGLEPIEAILRTGAQRLRPVLLTTVTTICGLLPMAFQVGVNFFTREVVIGSPGSDWWNQLATAVAYGLGFATVLTLIVTPAALAVPVRMREWARARRTVAPGAGSLAKAAE